MQATTMAQDRSLLRRGAKKMQDGQLGKPGEPAGGEEDDVNIHIGDVSITQPVPATQQPPNNNETVEKPLGSLAKQLALATALGLATGGLGGVGTAWLAGAFDQPSAVSAVDTDTDTQYELTIETE